MRIFETKLIEQVKGKQVYEKLVVNGECLLDQFESDIQGIPQYVSEFKTLIAYMDLLAKGNNLPITKFREIKGGGISTKRHEFKSKHLRIYALDKPDGKIVILGGYKNTQPKDIRSLNSIVKDYILSTR